MSTLQESEENKNNKSKKKKKFDPENEQLDIRINSFGEIISNYSIDDINEFLNENLSDRKLNSRKEKEEE